VHREGCLRLAIPKPRGHDRVELIYPFELAPVTTL
jgi:hypothetical protein